eukprot:scaffold1214_cov136-Isochrysis_galbana.AAC.6
MTRVRAPSPLARRTWYTVMGEGHAANGPRLCRRICRLSLSLRSVRARGCLALLQSAVGSRGGL